MTLISVDAAQTELLSAVRPTGSERVPLGDAGGRVLAVDLKARRTQPPVPISSMDGYAVSAASAGDVWLRVIGEAAAGHGFAADAQAGEAVRIFTGAPLPAGTDCVVMQEEAERDGDRVRFKSQPVSGHYVRARGIDFSEGDVCLNAGVRLGFGTLGLAAAMNHESLSVRRRPRVALIASGDELMPPGSVLQPHQIVASSSVALAHLIAEAGGVPIDLGIAPDDLGMLRRHIRLALDGGADVVVVIGGASVGDHDYTRAALEAEGAAIGFWKVAMRPGKPLMHGRVGQAEVLGLPGNPVSTLVCGVLFLAPLIRALLGRCDVLPETLLAVLDGALGPNDLRRDYLRGHLATKERQLHVTPFAKQDSSLMRTMAAANALVIRPEHAPAISAGEMVEVIRLDRD
ncbi:Molybdopterin molybdenumtransferase [Pleomorphomonas sp. T1.2MG-36]|uniref:molybdopterin molybdotransferase MoeA n=1 Tax=Pleomorphomonas sp. T1.2MG-36 TaxID=3041167 RepID=UPI002477B66B|nr:gephyrin-like molybdotransferase Glp [Pleomorphomonas sp. T1.2MG-36]CAI9406199.1 Molybdopterin molybdenumtransferase [Pleomorphomonas sp. T1.2MG-36]